MRREGGGGVGGVGGKVGVAGDGGKGEREKRKKETTWKDFKENCSESRMKEKKKSWRAREMLREGTQRGHWD